MNFPQENNSNTTFPQNQNTQLTETQTQNKENFHQNNEEILSGFQNNLGLSITQAIDEYPLNENSQTIYIPQEQQQQQEPEMKVRSSFDTNRFWNRRKELAREINYDEKKARGFPEMRIRRMMKSELTNPLKKDITEMMIKACELFIMEITDKTIHLALNAKRKSIRIDDIIQVLVNDHKFDFCVDLITLQKNQFGDYSQ